MALKNTGLQGREAQAKTRLLLALWDLGGAKQEVNRSEVTDRVQRSKEKKAEYNSILEKLEKAEAITITTKKRVVNVSLTNKGLQMLDEGIKSADFQFENNVGAKIVNALLKWIREMDGAVSFARAHGVNKEIASYEEFEKVALEVYDRLNRDYNHNNLVPIYQIRREIGDRTSRDNFNNWLRKMQVQDIFLLQGGEMPDITPDKAEDSISTSLGELRYYATRLSS